MYRNNILTIPKGIGICLLALLSCLALFACEEQPDMPVGDTLHTTDVVRTGGLAEYGDYVYYVKGQIFRLNRRTLEYTAACTDPECKGDCLLESPLTYVSQVVDGRLYFSTMVPYVRDFVYAYLDMATGAVTPLRVCSEIESPGTNLPFVDGDLLYYTCKKLKEGGDPTNPNDYRLYACRMPVTGGEEEALCPLASDSEKLLYVYEGKLITSYNQGLHALDPVTGERTVVFDAAKEGFVSFGDYMSYLDGKIYCLARKGDYVVSDIGESYSCSYLICIDLEAQTVKQLFEEPIISFLLTDDAIYYSPFEIRYLYVSPDGSRPNVKLLASPHLYACDPEGKNSVKVYSNDKMDYMEEYTVIDNTLYGILFDYDESKQGWGSSYFGMIDFTTGKVTRLGDFT